MSIFRWGPTPDENLVHVSGTFSKYEETVTMGRKGRTHTLHFIILEDGKKYTLGGINWGSFYKDHFVADARKGDHIQLIVEKTDNYYPTILAITLNG
jgi:hypothetical protein